MAFVPDANPRQETDVVGRLSRSLPAHSVSDLPVYVARRPPLHSVKRVDKSWRLAQTPYKIGPGVWHKRLYNDQTSAHAAGKRRTFFLPLKASVILFDGKKVSSMYFVANSTRSRLQLRLSLCLIFSRWLSTVFTLKFNE